MDWDVIIDRNRQALKTIVAALFALGGLAEGAVVRMMPRPVHRALLMVLRPAESALRRLIVIAARGLVLKPRAPRPMDFGLRPVSAGKDERIPAFCLFDPLKAFHVDDFDANSLLRHGFVSGSVNNMQMSIAEDKLVDGQSLCHRLNALRHALDNVPGQARRLARFQARRDEKLRRKGPFRPVRMSPMRPGLAPGYRQRMVHPVDAVLRDCHYFAIEALNQPDSS